MNIPEMTEVVSEASELIDRLEARIKRATELLREWRDKYGGKEHIKFSNTGGSSVIGASPTDLIRDTQRWIEGK
jgi:hypothetical protein